jgi:hypothetical protein
MKTVLLAIAGETPDRRILDHAVALCTQLRARIKVLQVIAPQRFRLAGDRIQRQTKEIRRYLENALTAATFAEAGLDPSTATEDLPVRPGSRHLFGGLTVTAGRPERALEDYIENQRDIVLAVYDPSLDDTRDASGTVPSRLKKSLPIPLVTARPGGSPRRSPCKGKKQ